MNKLIKPFSVFFSLYLLWLLADNILDEIDFFARFWWFFYHLLLKVEKIISVYFLSIFWNIKAIITGYRDIALPNGEIITIWNNYLGYDIIALFTCFIIAWPAKWKNRIWFIISGNLLIFLVNTLLLSIVMKQISVINLNSPIPQLNRYKTVLYIITVILWIIFIVFFSDKKFIKSLDIRKDKTL